MTRAGRTPSVARRAATSSAWLARSANSAHHGTPSAMMYRPERSVSFDVVVGTFVLCTVGDVASTLREGQRVLRPGGTLRFLEHGRSDWGAIARLQTCLAPAWSHVAGAVTWTTMLDPPSRPRAFGPSRSAPVPAGCSSRSWPSPHEHVPRGLRPCARSGRRAAAGRLLVMTRVLPRQAAWPGGLAALIPRSTTASRRPCGRPAHRS